MGDNREGVCLKLDQRLNSKVLIILQKVADNIWQIGIIHLVLSVI